MISELYYETCRAALEMVIDMCDRWTPAEGAHFIEIHYMGNPVIIDVALVDYCWRAAKQETGLTEGF